MSNLPPRIDEIDSSHHLTGRATLRRVGRWAFPTHELTQEGNAVARLGRTGWLRIYMGSGQRIEIPTGEQWRVRAIGHGGSAYPVIVDSFGRKIAVAGSRHGAYAINGKDYACALYPAEKPLLGIANKWILRQFEDELATITRYPLSVNAALPVHLGAVLLSFALVRYGLPDDSRARTPAFHWGVR
jgi:hypothetical protein